jgi:hypothetical protein
VQTPRLNLVVVRVADIDRAASFYRLLGSECSKHGHGLLAEAAGNAARNRERR